MRNYRCDFLKGGVSTRVITVRMGIDHESNGFARKELHRLEQLARDFRTTGVNHDDTVFAGRSRDVAFITLQQRYAAG